MSLLWGQEIEEHKSIHFSESGIRLNDSMGLFVRSEWVVAPAVGSLPGTAPYFLRCFESVRQIVSYGRVTFACAMEPLPDATHDFATSHWLAKPESSFQVIMASSHPGVVSTHPL